MYGVWLAGFMKSQPITMTMMTMETLVTTMMPLTNADSCMPRISSADMIRQDADRGEVQNTRARRVASVSTSHGEWHH